MRKATFEDLKKQVAENYELVKKICESSRKSKRKYYHENESPKAVGKEEAERIRAKRSQENRPSL